jgi:hypothetical protein
MSKAIYKKALPSLLPLALPHPVISETPEPVPTIKPNDDEEKRESPEAVEEDSFPSQGVPISLFLK